MLWACPACGRSVPARVVKCRCGVERVSPGTAWVSATRGDPGRRRSRLSRLDVAGWTMALAGIGYLGLSWREQPMPEPPPERPARAQAASSEGAPPPDSDPPAAAPERPLAPEPVTSPPSQPWEGKQSYEAATPADISAESRPAAAAPVASPTPASRRPELSETEIRREACLKRLDKVFAQFEEDARQLLDDVVEFRGSCFDTTVSAASCSRLHARILAGRLKLAEGVEAAEDDARRSMVEPGILRDLRRQYHFEEQQWDELSAMVQRADKQYRGQL